MERHSHLSNLYIFKCPSQPDCHLGGNFGVSLLEINVWRLCGKLASACPRDRFRWSFHSGRRVSPPACARVPPSSSWTLWSGFIASPRLCSEFCYVLSLTVFSSPDRKEGLRASSFFFTFFFAVPSPYFFLFLFLFVDRSEAVGVVESISREGLQAATRNCLIFLPAARMGEVFFLQSVYCLPEVGKKRPQP